MLVFWLCAHAALSATTASFAASGPPGSVLHTVQAALPGTRFGGALASVGDCDGDGAPDLAVGAYRSAGPTGGPGGAIHLVSGASGLLVWSAAGTGSGWLGAELVGIADLDGDGRPDVLAGEPLGASGAGCVEARSGASGALLWKLAGSAGGDRFGEALASPGDVTGDGVPDIAVGAPLHDGAGTYAGRVELRSGADRALVWSLAGLPFDQFGADLAALGDVDGDGAVDLAVGAPFDDRGGFNAGAVIVVSGRTGARLYELLGRAAGDWMGQRVAAAGDVDRDGFVDLAVGIPGADRNGIDSGAAEVRSGAHGGLLLEIPGEQAGEYLMAVAGPGDSDGDGVDDLLVGAASGAAAEAGRARLVSGRTAAVLCSFDGLAPRAWFGAAVSRLGDVDGDGRADLAVGAPGHDDEPTAVGYVQLLRCAPLGGTIQGVSLPPRPPAGGAK